MSVLRTQLGTTGLRNGTVRGRAAVALQSNGAVPLAPLVSLARCGYSPALTWSSRTGRLLILPQQSSERQTHEDK